MKTRKSLYRQFDRQTNDTVFTHIEMSNLYLKIEREGLPVSMQDGNRLWQLLNLTYPAHKDNGIISMRKYWEAEFEKLPSWNGW